MGKIYTSAEQLIGNTPIIELKQIKEKLGLCANVFAKLEFFNPAGSIKDRVALSMINEAEKCGILKKDSVIIEPTSGNTGIGLALVSARKGYRAIIVMPDTMSKERISLMKAYGAEVVLSDGSKGMSGAIEKAEEISKNYKNSFIPSQFTNPANPLAHFSATGPEIWEDMDGKIDVLVAGVGTGGTITGIGKYLKSQKDDIEIVGFEPFTSPFITKGEKGAHGLQGIGAGFIPDVLDIDILSETLTVKDEDAFEMCRMLGREEGLFVGITSGAALSASIEIAKREENRAKNIVTVFPDTGARYLSVGIFDEE